MFLSRDISTSLRFAQYDVVEKWCIAYARSNCSIAPLVQNVLILTFRTLEISGLIFSKDLWFSEYTENN